MATQNLASADAILKDVYEGPVIEQLNYKTYMIDQIERESQFQMDATGRNAILAAHVGRNRGRGARADGGVLPTAGLQKWQNITVSINYFLTPSKSRMRRSKPPSRMTARSSICWTQRSRVQPLT